MMKPIKTVVVLGAGTMGGGIAAHLANAGVQVFLGDVTKEKAQEGLDRLKKTSPAPFMHKDRVRFVTPEAFEDLFPRLQTIDWVIEAVVESLEIKKALYEKVDNFRGKETLVSSNTSTLPLSRLVEGRSKAFQKAFFITHFFNPPRYMPLLEIVKGPESSEEALHRLSTFCDHALGKDIVMCRDTPGFIANRLGVYWVQTAILEAKKHGIRVEEADFILSKVMHLPKTGVFGLVDLIGLDLIPFIGASLREALSPQDAYVREYQDLPFLSDLLTQGYTGRKGKGGFYRLNETTGKKEKESLNLQTGQYEPVQRTEKSTAFSLKDLPALLKENDRRALYAWRVLSKVFLYTLTHAEEMADSLHDIDQAMKKGYKWGQGPFELMETIGLSWMAQHLEQEGETPPLWRQGMQGKSFYSLQGGKRLVLTSKGDYVLPRQEPGVLKLTDIKRTETPLLKNSSAHVWDIGDGVCCFELVSLKNTLDPEGLALLDQAIDLVQKDYKALVIHNEGEHFSLGANLGLALFVANLALWDQFEALIDQGQTVYDKMKYAPFPVVVATQGMTLGGGCELALHADAIQAHAETYMGLVEVGVGLIPAWGGCKELLRRWIEHKKGFGGPMVAVANVFESIATAQVSKSAEEARDLKFLRETDGITMNQNRLLTDAKAKALAMVSAGYIPPDRKVFSLPGKTALIALDLAVKGFVKVGKASPYDAVITKELATVLTGGALKVPLSEEDLQSLEKQAFMTLVKQPKTLERIESIVLTNKPLRN